jgi:hypothetical protein
MDKKRLKQIVRRGWDLLVVLIWGAYVYEIVFTANSQDYGVKEWGLFGGLTFTIGVQLWSIFQKSIKPERVDSRNS